MPGFLKSRPSRVLTLVLAVQAILFYTLSRGEAVSLALPLSGFPSQVGGWTLATEGVIEKEIRDVLRADDILNRVYTDADGRQSASLFVAYFKTQRTGQTPHSPQNCLPGSGWTPSRIGFIRIDLPDRPQPIEINRYIVAKGESKSLVLYWYQSRDRVIAREFSAKFWLVADSIRYRRSDTALVRVVVPVSSAGEEAATEAAVGLVRSFFPVLRQYLPS
jgi:EpsI family protein